MSLLILFIWTYIIVNMGLSITLLKLDGISVTNVLISTIFFISTIIFVYDLMIL